MSQDNHIPVIIIGGGIIGLSIANSFLENNFYDFCILDKAPYLGDHSSGRNSGVMHAGLYYPQDSLKKKFCIEGLELWKRFCNDNDLFHRNCGKYIFTTKNKEEHLLSLKDRAISNGVDIRMASQAEVTEISEYCHADIAFYSPNTSIIDPSEALTFLKNKVESQGIPVLLNQTITEINQNKGFELVINGEKIHCDKLINAAGLGAVGIRTLLGLQNIENKYVKGHYVRYKKPFYNESLLYPIPLKNLKGLGVHTCIDSDGSIKFGPDAQDCNEVNYSLHSENIKMLKDEVLQNFKVSRDDLSEDYVGLRSKIKIDGELHSDFYLGTDENHNIKDYIELLGFESPGFTSSLAVSKYISKLIIT